MSNTTLSLLPSPANYAEDFFAPYGVALACLVLFLLCYRRSSSIPWQWRLRGLPCSPRMVAMFFDWHGLQDDGFGGTGGQSFRSIENERQMGREMRRTLVPPTATDSSSAATAPPSASESMSSEPTAATITTVQVAPSDETDPYHDMPIMDYSSDNTFCPKLTWPPRSFQITMCSDFVVGILWAVSLFVDRWFLTPRLDQSPMESEVIWGNLQIKYGTHPSGRDSILGPPTHHYDCADINVLSYMESGECGALVSTGVIIYIIGLIYFLLIFTRIYTSLYASLRNVALIAYRYRVANRGLSKSQRKKGCRCRLGCGRGYGCDRCCTRGCGCKCGCDLHMKLIYIFLHVRYWRFYILTILLAPLVIFRYLILSDSTRLIGGANFHAGPYLLFILIVLELVTLVFENSQFEAILTRLDLAAEERHRRGAYEDDDELNENEDELNLSITDDSNDREPSSRRSRRPQRHLHPSDEELQEEHRLETERRGGFGPLAYEFEENDDNASWTMTDADRERQVQLKAAAANGTSSSSSSSHPNGRISRAQYDDEERKGELYDVDEPSAGDDSHQPDGDDDDNEERKDSTTTTHHYDSALGYEPTTLAVIPGQQPGVYSSYVGPTNAFPSSTSSF